LDKRSKGENPLADATKFANNARVQRKAALVGARTALTSTDWWSPDAASEFKIPGRRSLYKAQLYFIGVATFVNRKKNTSALVNVHVRSNSTKMYVDIS
jgi:hypothetical protein